MVTGDADEDASAVARLSEEYIVLPVSTARDVSMI
jgi:hypothetical protein